MSRITKPAFVTVLIAALCLLFGSALAAGGARRVIGVYAGLQMLLPAAGFALAMGLSRHRPALGDRP